MSAHASLANRLTVLVFFILSGCFLFFFCPYGLVYKEQLILFESTRVFSKPAAIAELVGTFLTQFYIFRWAAVLITLLIAVLLWDGFRRVLNFIGAKHSAILSLAPAAAEMVLCCQYEYPISMTIGAAISVWMAVGCLNIKKPMAGTIVSIICALACYPAAGIHCLLFFITLWAGKGAKALQGLGILACAAAYIWASGRLYLIDPAQAFAYPLITGSAIGNVYTLFATEVIALACISVAGLRCPAWAAASAVFVLAGTALSLCRDGKTEYDLKISTLAYFGHWDTVLQMGKENPYNSQMGAYYYNMALAKRGELAQGLLEAYQPMCYGLFLPVDTKSGYPKYIASADALLLCGDYSQAQHSAHIGMTFTPHCRSSRAARKLAEIAIADGDNAVATKYLNMLSHSIMHRKWALDALDLIKDGTTYRENNNREILVSANDFGPALRNIIESGDSHSSTAVEYLLCLDLLKKNSKDFLSDYHSYFLPFNAGKPLPELYMEALAMLGLGEEYGVSEEMTAACRDFLSGNHGKYKDTYWYYLLYAQPGN
ncbi:MAG: hypothetical protein KBT00_05670 [Bacteroidales bacterium]|nr:hypothetical protein [Candidatus Cacconaster merdequi]